MVAITAAVATVDQLSKTLAVTRIVSARARHPYRRHLDCTEQEPRQEALT